MRLGARKVRKSIWGKNVIWDSFIWKSDVVDPFLLLPAVSDLGLPFTELFVARPYLLFLARPDAQLRLFLGRNSYDETMCLVS